MSRMLIALTVMLASVGTAASDDTVQCIRVDVTGPSHAYWGFGVQVWPGDARVERVIDGLHAKWVRLSYATVSDVPAEGSRKDYDAYWAKSNVSGMQTTWEILHRHDVKMILCNFATPPVWLREKTLDVRCHAAYARWWGALVGFLSAQGMRPSYLELFNEPDGDWNGRVPPADYNHVVQQVRAELDARGLNDVGILGPGLAHVDLEGRDAWLDALDERGVAGLSGFSTHGWEWRAGKNDGACYVRTCWEDGFAKSLAARDPSRSKPVFVTEFATKADTFHGAKPPSPSDSVPWAVRVFENVLSFFNGGANAALYWQAADMDWEPNAAWGLINLKGDERPAFKALRTLIPEIPEGARILYLGKQDGAIYAAAFAKEQRIVLVLANASDAKKCARIELQGARNARCIKTAAFPDGSADQVAVQFVPGESSIPSAPVTLAGDSTLCIVAEIDGN